MNEKFFLPATLLLCVLACAAWHQFIYEPARREMLSMELETRRLREVEREIVELKARHGDLTALAELKASQLDEARRFIPTELEQDEFLDAVYRAAEEVDVRILSVRADEAKTAADGMQSLVVSVRAEADYVALLNFLRMIVDGERLTRLERFYVTSEAGEVLACEASFKIFAASP